MRPRSQSLRSASWWCSGRSRSRRNTPLLKRRISGTRCCRGFRCRRARCTEAWRRCSGTRTLAAASLWRASCSPPSSVPSPGFCWLLRWMRRDTSGWNGSIGGSYCCTYLPDGSRTPSALARGEPRGQHHRRGVLRCGRFRGDHQLAADRGGGHLAAAGLSVLSAQPARRTSDFGRHTAGGFLALSVLSGHHAVPVFASLAIVALGIAALVRGQIRWNSAALRTSIVFVVAGCGAAVQLLPVVEYGHYSLRWVNADHPVDWRSLPRSRKSGMESRGLIFLVVPGTSGTIVDPIVGVVPLALAAAALLAVPRRKAAGPLAALALGATLFSFARFNVFHGVLYALLPGLEKARAPIMAMAVADVAVAALAAFGIDALLAHAVPGLRRLRIGLALGSAFLFLLALYPPAVLRNVSHGAGRAGMIASSSHGAALAAFCRLGRETRAARAVGVRSARAHADRDRQQHGLRLRARGRQSVAGPSAAVSNDGEARRVSQIPRGQRPCLLCVRGPGVQLRRLVRHSFAGGFSAQRTRSFVAAWTVERALPGLL